MAVRLLNTLKHFLLFLSVFGLLAGCISPKPLPDVKKNIWVGEITGMAIGKMRIIYWQTEGNNTDQMIQGNLVIDVEQAANGQGGVCLKSSLKGRIKNKLMEVKFSGNVEDATFHGKLTGTMAESHGYGTYMIYVPDEAAGQYTGKWTLKKQ